MYTVRQVINSVFCATSKSAEEPKPLDPPPTEGKDQEKSVCLTKTSPFYVTVIFPVVNWLPKDQMICYTKDIWPLKKVDISTIHLALVVQKVDSTIHRINLYPVDIASAFPNAYPLDSDLSDG